MPELSKEMQQNLMSELDTDSIRMHELIGSMQQYGPGIGNWQWNQRNLEALEYITLQMRLKLKMLGAGRIWDEELES